MIGELYKPMLRAADRRSFHDGPREAAHATRFLGVEACDPMHYATFPFLTGTPEQLKQQTKDMPDSDSRVEAWREPPWRELPGESR